MYLFVSNMSSIPLPFSSHILPIWYSLFCSPAIFLMHLYTHPGIPPLPRPWALEKRSYWHPLLPEAVVVTGQPSNPCSNNVGRQCCSQASSWPISQWLGERLRLLWPLLSCCSCYSVQEFLLESGQHVLSTSFKVGQQEVVPKRGTDFWMGIGWSTLLQSDSHKGLECRSTSKGRKFSLLSSAIKEKKGNK